MLKVKNKCSNVISTSNPQSMHCYPHHAIIEPTLRWIKPALQAPAASGSWSWDWNWSPSQPGALWRLGSGLTQCTEKNSSNMPVHAAASPFSSCGLLFSAPGQHNCARKQPLSLWVTLQRKVLEMCPGCPFVSHAILKLIPHTLALWSVNW